jgi:hypothetical protein
MNGKSTSSQDSTLLPAAPPVGSANSGFDFITEYVRYADVLEAPPQVHEMVAIQLIATTLNMNGVVIQHGSMTHPLDVWIVLLSGSGFGRNTVLRFANPIVSGAGLESIFRQDTWGSPQAMMQQMSLHPSGLYVWGEMSEKLMLLSDTKFGNAKPWLTDRYDNSAIPNAITYRQSNKLDDTPPIIFSQPPRLNILATSSLNWFFTYLRPDDSAGGFVPRWLIVHAQDIGRRIPTPKEPNQQLLQPLAEHLGQVSQLKGPADLSLITDKYNEWYRATYDRFSSKSYKELAMAYFNRHRVHVLKLAVIYEVSSSASLKVTNIAWERAAATASELEEILFRLLPTGMSNSGFSRSRMEQKIRDGGCDGIKQSEFTHTFENIESRERNDALVTLCGAEAIFRFYRQTSGRHATILVHKDYIEAYMKKHPADVQRSF